VNKNHIKEEKVYVKELLYIVDVFAEASVSSDKSTTAANSDAVATSTKNTADPAVVEKSVETAVPVQKVSNVFNLVRSFGI
jgi:hypothetical protein